MTDVMKIFDELRGGYLRYFDSPFDLRFDELVEERRTLLDRDGILYRDPLIEPQPPYPSSGHDIFGAARAALTGVAGWQPSTIDDLAQVASEGFFFSSGAPLQLFQHQFEMLRIAEAERRDAVILTGTGSGKTEAIYLPVLAALIKESQRWPAVAAPARNDWWNMSPPAGSNRRTNHPRIGQRAHEQEARLPGLRAVVLYPLNALAEDQMIRLRRALDSDAIRNWLRANRGGNRFWFGRYTGWTPVSGRSTDDQAEAELRRVLRQLEATAARVRNTPAQLFFPRLDGGEMWSRWDMQEAAPDLLITNYSMLNIMLMRDVEASIFDQTRQWLQSDPRNVFHLVIDELHTYRGTPGTEVAYILRVLLDRIGLHPDHEQLRILASSASLTDDGARAQDYLRQFFGRSLPFRLVRGQPVAPRTDGAARIAPLASHFVRLEEALREGAAQQINAAVDQISQTIGMAVPNAQLPPAKRLGQVMSEIELPDAIRSACSDGNGTIIPKSPTQIGARLFPTTGTVEQASAGRGAVSALVNSENLQDAPLLPVRTHIFFRNVQGIWACSDPQCTAVVRQDPEISIGRLFDRSTTTCACGARVLELLYCEPCGDVFLGGYRREIRPNVWLLVPDDPNIEKAPDHSANDRSYDNYAVYWPSRVQPQTDHWTQESVRRQWRPAVYDTRTGTVALARRRADATGWLYYVPQKHGANRQNLAHSATNDRPSLCPHCDANWSRLENAAPIRTQRTGFQRIAQVLTDSLLREIAPPEADHVEDPKRKLVLFSDSRQDAAKLSVGVAKAHWLDAVRQVAVEAANEDVRSVTAFQRRTRGERSQMTLEELRLAANFSASNPEEASAILATEAGNGADPSPIGGLTQQQLANRALARASAGVVPSQRLELLSAQRLLNVGMNPGGVDRSVTWTDLEREQGEWQKLFDWNRSPPSFRLDLSPEEQDHRRRIGNSSREAISETIFSGGKRDFESLLLGTITFDPAFAPANDAILQETSDSVIRMLGKRRRIDTHRATDNDQILPGYTRNYITAVANANGRDPGVFVQDVTDVLTRSGAYDQGILIFGRLFVRRAGAFYYRCPTCSRIHSHQSGRICSNCEGPLTDQSRFDAATATGERADYYRWLATEAGPVFRLNCAEMTGQTDKFVARDRQRLFQSITIGQEQPRTDILDLLSVTTTMEAGVDIGSLLAAMMANMPPMRFNYQQRVGRAGRRGSAYSVALTLCRGRSHDDYYFQRPDRITSDPPPPPYVDTARAQILQRVLNKEVLRQAFAELDLFNNTSGDSVHGEFGLAAAWNQAPQNQPTGYYGATVGEVIQEWIGRNGPEIERLCDALLVGTSLAGDAAARTEILDRVRISLVPEATASTNDQAMIQPSLSERLANNGLLPMFGFPTKARNLYHNFPRGWPPKEIVNRDLELAISMFAPGAETVKERAIHTAIGVVHYEKQGPSAVEGADPLGPPVIVGLCGACQHVETQHPDSPACPVCAAPAGFGDRDFRRVDLRQPKGFRSYYAKARDYDGVFDFVPRASRPKVGRPNFAINSHLNFTVGAGPGALYVINDNAGKLFEFSQVWQNQSALIHIPSADSAAAKFAEGQPNARIPVHQAIGNPISCALAAISRTDMLLLGIRQYGAGRAADPTTPQGRAALYSLAFILRRAAAVLLDVQDYELKAGIRTLEDPGRGIAGEIFLSDTLENGAGYATYLGQPAVAEQLLRMIAEPGHRDFHERIVADLHSNACDTSCPDCLRSYSNLQYHNLLDWRLAFDMARLALDASTQISLAAPHWTRVADLAAVTLAAARRGWQRTTFAGLPAVSNGREAVIVVHPLWNTSQAWLGPEVAAAWNDAQRGGHQVTESSFVSVFKALRQPL